MGIVTFFFEVDQVSFDGVLKKYEPIWVNILTPDESMKVFGLTLHETYGKVMVAEVLAIDI